jgi:hypothetical protein
VQHVGHELLEARILHARDAFRAREIRRGLIAAGLTLARVVDQELRDLAERPAFLAAVHDEAGSARLCLAHALLEAVRQIGAAGANVRTEHIRTVALVVHAAGQRRAGSWIALGSPKIYSVMPPIGGRNTCNRGA